MAFDHILRWEREREKFCEAIGHNRAALKILLKTKNDGLLIEKWIEHHLNIVGDGNIIILDNMSDEPDIFGVYERYAGRIEIAQFGGFHNNVHQVELFQDLYDALARSCDFFIFLDTDEFLVMIDENRYYRDTKILGLLSENPDADVIPGTWLYNCDWNSARFVCGTDFGEITRGLIWGKPMLRSNLKLSGCINHNIQLDKRLFMKPVSTKLFVLHMANLSPSQRIKSNLYKLVARKFASENESPDDVINRDLTGIKDNNIIQYVNEIRRLLSVQRSSPKVETTQGKLRTGCLELLDDNSISFYSATERELLMKFISEPEYFYKKAGLTDG